MKNQNNSPLNVFQEQGKTREKNTQLQTIFHFLEKNVATASMVSAATGVPQKNICRYKRDLENAGRLWEVEKRYCQTTGFRAWYLTTDFDKIPKSQDQPKNQLELF